MTAGSHGAGSGPAQRRFEGSYLGDASRIGPGDKLECKICWWVYDPAQGDAEGHVAPHTPFTALPAHWRCPECDGDKEQFMVMR